MEQKVGGFDPEEYHLGMQLREQLAVLPRLSSEQVASALRILGGREEEYLEFLQTSSEVAQEELARNKREMAQLKGGNPSRPNLTAEKIVHGVYYPIHNAALDAYKDLTLPKHVFISWYDYASGIADVTSDIFEAEQAIEGLTDKNAVETVTKIEESRLTPLPPDAGARLYLFQVNTARRNTQLLMDDPTGHKLIETAVEEIRQDAGKPPRERAFHRFHTYQEPRLVLAGAEFTRRAYQALYPLTR